MSALTDFFIATEAELQAAFPLRYPVAARPKSRKVKNPFTGEPMTVREWGPAEPFPTDREPPPLPDRAELKAVQRQPLAQFKRVDPAKLASLHSLVTGAT